MNNLNKNPLAWFVAVIVIGWFMIENSNFELFTLFALAVIVSKQVELLSK